MHFRNKARSLVAAVLAGAVIAASGVARGEDSFQQGLDAYLKGDYHKAMTIWKPAAEAGDEVAAFNVGVLYAQGLGVEADPRAAVRWYRRSALAGYANAQFNLGAAYYHGQGTDVNLSQAVSWWEKAARQDHPEALYNLATLYRRGEGVKQDTARARSLFKRAADLGDTRAQEALANLGAGKSKQPKQAGGGEQAGSGKAEAGGGGGKEPAPAASSPSEPRDSVAREDPGHWTVQLFAADSRQAAQRFVRIHGLSGQVRIYEARVKGKTWFKGIYGSYADKSGARAAQAELKKKLPGAAPWLRSFRAIQAEVVAGTAVETAGAKTVSKRPAESDGSSSNGSGSGSGTKPNVASAGETGPTTKSNAASASEAGTTTEPNAASASEAGTTTASARAAKDDSHEAGAVSASSSGRNEQAELRRGQKAFNAQDYKTAFDAWRPLAEKGVAEAQYGIAFMYESGWGVDKDYARAFHWYELAAQQGHVKSEFNLGMLYMNGEGVAKNQALGLYWIQSAADRGDDRAASYLKNLD